MNVTKRNVAKLAAALLISGSVGCGSMNKNAVKQGSFLNSLPLIGNSSDEPEPYPNPVKLATTWTPDVLTKVGKTPTRGFGGRVFFYNDKSEPVPVEGSLIVHAFDESKKGEEGSVKRFAFTPEQFTKHFSQSDIGASYSFWIPWDAAGGEQAQVSMVASFETSEGKVIQGSPTKILLPGRTEKRSESLARRYSPQYNQWKMAQSGSKLSPSGLTTTTIARNGVSTQRSRSGNLSAPRESSIATGDTTPTANVRLASQKAQPKFGTASVELKKR